MLELHLLIVRELDLVALEEDSYDHFGSLEQGLELVIDDLDCCIDSYNMGQWK